MSTVVVSRTEIQQHRHDNNKQQRYHCKRCRLATTTAKQTQQTVSTRIERRCTASFDSPSLSWPLFRQQHWVLGVEIYGPAADCAGGSTTLTHLLRTSPSNGVSTAFNKSFDSLSLATIGASTSNKALVQQAAALYVEAVTSLRREISHAILSAKRGYTCTDQLLATPYLLFLSGMFCDVSGQGNDLFMHLFGLARMLQLQRQPQKSLLACKLLDNYHHFLFALGISVRKAMPCYMTEADEAQLQQVADRCPTLTRFCMRVPALLEQAEVVDIQCYADVVALLEDIAHVEASIQAWLHEQASETRGRFTYQTTPLCKLPTFNSYVDDLTLSTFDHGYSFSSFGSALAHNRAWACLLVTSSVKLKLARDSDKGEIAKQIIQQGDRVADDLCRATLYFIGTPTSGTHGWTIAGGAFSLLTQWSTATENHARLRWIQAIKDLSAEKHLKTWNDLSFRTK